MPEALPMDSFILTSSFFGCSSALLMQSHVKTFNLMGDVRDVSESAESHTERDRD